MDFLKQRTFLGIIPLEDELEGVFSLSEITALMKYAAEHGMDDDGLLARLYEEIALFSRQRKIAQAKVILSEYTKLCKLTAPVNGRNVEGATNLLGETKSFVITTFIIFLTSVFLLAIGSWFNDELLLDDGHLVYPGLVCS